MSSKKNDVPTPAAQHSALGAIAADFGPGFHVVAGVKPPPALDALEVSFGFACSVSRDPGQTLVRFGIFDFEGQLAVVCGLQGLVQASEFSGLIAKLGYERKAASTGKAGGFDFAYFPGAAEDPTTAPSVLR